MFGRVHVNSLRLPHADDNALELMGQHEKIVKLSQSIVELGFLAQPVAVIRCDYNETTGDFNYEVFANQAGAAAALLAYRNGGEETVSAWVVETEEQAAMVREQYRYQK